MRGLLSLALVIAAGCAPGPAPSSVAPTIPIGDGARLDVEMGGTIGCATFPYGCGATLSVVAAGTTVAPEWRPPASDPRWLPDDSRGTSPDRLDPVPLGALPKIPTGAHQVVVSLLGSYDTPSHAPDGSVATDLLSRCIGDVEVGPTTAVVEVRVTFTPDPASFRAACTIEVRPAGG